MTSIVLIVPYFGKWPFWFPAFLKSCGKNPTIAWLFFTDCDPIPNPPDNVTFIESEISEMELLFSEKLGMKIQISKPYKFCDLRPSYGYVFADYIKKYDFWGFTDIDIIWGDIRKFMTEDLLNGYDIISSRIDSISGHFTIFKNNILINTIYKSLPNYTQILSTEKYLWSDEQVLTQYLKKVNSNDTPTYKVFWDTVLLNQERGRDSHQEYHLDKWLWRDGKMLELKDGNPINEVMYLHFINWKRTMKYSKIKFTDHPNQFYISYNGMHYKPHTNVTKLVNRFKNLYVGYYAILFRKHILKKVKKKIKF